MHSSIFFVGSEPYCVWDVDLDARREEYLSAMDPEYFLYVSERHSAATDEKRSALALRLHLHHSLETFFSLVGAFVQAVDCPFAWIARCSNHELYEVVSRISRRDPTLFTKLPFEGIGWDLLSDQLFRTIPDSRHDTNQLIEAYARLWEGAAKEFLAPERQDEYNALKHGFRVGSGGFRLEFAPHTGSNQPPEPSSFKKLGEAKFGTTFLKVSPITKKKSERSLNVQRHYNNWPIERVLLLNRSLFLSIHNFTRAFHLSNARQPIPADYRHPVELDALNAAWNYSPGVSNLHWHSQATSAVIPSLSRQQIEERIALHRAA